MKQSTYDTVARVAPFAIYMSFVALLEIPSFLGMAEPSQSFVVATYPVKTALVILSLVVFWKSYTDLDWGSLKDIKATGLSIGIGILVFILWINMDFPWAIQGELTTYDPASLHQGTMLIFLIVSRVIGAAIVVPIMEELFWRSFLCRYLVGKDFMQVRAGTFTLFSFAATSVLFGLEHQLYLAGIVAGIAFNYIYWQTKSLSQCILSHAVTNAILAGYVLATRSWQFW